MLGFQFAFLIQLLPELLPMLSLNKNASELLKRCIRYLEMSAHMLERCSCSVMVIVHATVEMSIPGLQDSVIQR